MQETPDSAPNSPVKEIQAGKSLTESLAQIDYINVICSFSEGEQMLRAVIMHSHCHYSRSTMINLH